MLMVETLEDAGFDILEAAGGMGACHLMDDPDNADLIVTDLNVPDADGIAIAEWLGSVIHPSGPFCPDLLRACALPWSYLAKPFSMAQLASRVVELLNQP